MIAAPAALIPASDQPLVIVLLGPTASGKTALAIELAQALGLAVLNVDSRQLYLHMDVGTAKPTAAQRAAVRHELLDLREPNHPINLQDFRAIAEPAIAAEHQRKGMALLAGGTGLYLKALTQGLQPPAVPPQPALRAQLEALGRKAVTVACDLSDLDAVGRLAEVAKAELGRIDVLVNNVGGTMPQRAAPAYKAHTASTSQASAATSQTSSNCAGSICENQNARHAAPKPAAPTSETVCCCALKRPHSHAAAAISVTVQSTK